MAIVAISTSDNPYNPFTQYDMWRGWDEGICGYFTSAYLGRIAAHSTEIDGVDEERRTEEAIDEIIEMNLPLVSPLTGEQVHYVKVVKPE